MSWLVGGAAFALYFFTLCPGVYVGDSGELATAATVLGVAHPPGYPLYVLVGRLFALLPAGTGAFRVNLMSAFFGAAAAGVLYAYVRALLRRSGEGGGSRGADLATAVGVTLLFTFARTVWGESVKAEVYSLNLFLAALVLLAAETSDRPALPFFLLGLAATNHPTVLLLAPGLVYRIAADGRWSAGAIAGSALAFLGGATLYAYLLVRPSTPELIAWRKPETLAALVNHVTRAQYGRLAENPRSIALALAQVVYLIRFLVREMGPVVILVPFALARAARTGAPAPARAVAIHFLLFSFGLLFLLNHGTDTRDGAVAAVFYLPAVLTGLALVAPVLRDLAARVARPAPALAATVLLFPAISFAANASACDARGFVLAGEVGRATLEGAPGNALLLTEGDNNTFVLSYLQAVEGMRPDVTILDRDLNLHPERFAPPGGGPVDASARDRFVEEAVRLGDRPVCSANAYTKETVAGKRLVSFGPYYRFIPVGEGSPPRTIEQVHPGGFRTGPLRDDYLAKRLAVSYLSRWIDHYRETRNVEGMGEIRDEMLAAGEGLRETHLALGGGIAATGDTAGALAELERSVDVDPEFLEARRELADLLLADGKLERAEEEYRLVARHTGRPGDRLNLANVLFLAGRGDEAAEEYADAMAAAEGDTMVLAGAANGLGRLGRYEEQVRALELLRAGVARFHRSEELGDVYDRLGRTGDALAAYQDALAGDPSSAVLSYKVGLLLLREGKANDAEAPLRRAVETDSAFAPALNALAYLYAVTGERSGEALGLADRAIRSADQGQVGYYHDTRGVILDRLGRAREAEAAFRRALELTPEADRAARAETCGHLADLAARRGDDAGAWRFRARADSLRGSSG